ncbi:FGGY family carbohydrate kinase [Escherichia coli]
MRQALHNAGIAPEYIAAVSGMFDARRHSFYIINKEPRSGPAPMWMPERHVKLANLKNCTTIPLKTKFIARPENTGFRCHPQITLVAHHRSDIYRQASTITMISDWLADMLSGELAVDPSNAGTTGLLDLTTRDWKPALLDMAGHVPRSFCQETGTLLAW